MDKAFEDISELRAIIHELRTPLTAATSTLQLLESKYPELSSERFLRSLENDLKYSADLLTHYSSYMTANKYREEAFDIGSLVKEVALSFAIQLSEEMVCFSSKIDLDDVTFMGDPIQIQQLLRNILKNAFQACEDNDTIFLHTYLENDAVIFSIEDTGCGMTEEQLPTIFDTFVTYKKKRGAGIGLPLCKRIVEVHHGTIEVTSSIGEGTTFRITLPMKQL